MREANVALYGFCKRVRHHLYLIVLFFLIGLTACNGSAEQTVTVSAAANLIPAFEEIAEQFEAETGITVAYNFGGSGTLAQQIQNGAPVDVFASANTDYVNQLVDLDIIDGQTNQAYALGRLVMWSNDQALLPAALEDLTSSDITSIAIANPEHAPYGVIARTVLQDSQLWDGIQPKLVMGNDVRQTLTYAETGDVSVALVPLSLVVNLDHGVYTLIPEDKHAPIIQALGIIDESPNRQEAEAFVNFVLGETGQSILQTYGYQSVLDP